MNAATNPWDKDGYGEITAVERRAGRILVSFANGDEVEVGVAALGLDEQTGFHIEEEGGGLIAETPQGEREIDWMLIRRIDDPEFAAVIRERDAEESRRIGTRLRVLRENGQLSQRDAAELAGMAAPQLAKIERGETDMRISTVRSVLRALGGSLADIAGPDAPEISVRQLERNAEKAGAPRDLLKRIAARVGARELPAVLSRGFAWDSEALMQGVPSGPPLQAAVRFKSRSREKERETPLLRLARTISELSVETYAKAGSTLSKEPAKTREQVLDESGEITLATLTRWAWEHGIVVIPMSGPGFSAAAWYVESRPVIVMKVSHNYLSYWLFTLAHEIGHLVLGHVGDKGLVDVDEPGVETEDKQEREANRFALELLVPDSSSLFEEIKRRSGDRREEQEKNFKWRAKDVAVEAGIDHALLCLVAAHELTDVAGPKDRWGSAINFGKELGAARPIVQEEFKRRADLQVLDELEAALIAVVVFE